MYHYKAKCLRVVDGDTVDLEVQLGFRLVFTDRFRLYGINAPEVRGEDREAGQESTEWLRQRLFDGNGDPIELDILTLKDRRGKFGRWLVKLLDPDEIEGMDFPTLEAYVSTLNALMVAEGKAVPANY